MADRIKQMVDIIADMSLKSGYSIYQVFTDWVQCTAIGIQNASCLLRSSVWESREKRYLDVYNRYSMNRFPELTALLAEELEEDMSDYNLATLIENDKIRTYEQLEPAARELEGMLRYIHDMQERMKE